MTQRKRIVLGMSGGVDSSTAAVILLRAGYEVEGVTCLFIADESAQLAAADAKKTCDRLGIAHHVFDCSMRFESQVISPFVHDYAIGLTPSPCVGCNARCKIPSLVEAADSLGCHYVATGHYAQVEQLPATGRYAIKKAADTTKDQSYMLSQLTQEQLSRLVLPLGEATKTQVRVQAQEMELSVADKPDSQDICFIEGSHLDFLREQGVNAAPGNIVDVSGTLRGVHQGLFAYTIGQRKGIGVAADRPYYVVEKRCDTNELVIGFKEETTIDGVEVTQMNWQAYPSLDEWLTHNEKGACEVKLRYRSQPAACTIQAISQSEENNAASSTAQAHKKRDSSAELQVRENTVAPDKLHKIAVRLATPQPSTAPGQYAVFYEEDTLLGGGIISQVWR